jgi:hypothetical protein
MVYYAISKNYPKKLSQAADEIFRVAAWTRSELAISSRFSVGQVDAEKLAQRSSVAASVLSCWSELARMSQVRLLPNSYPIEYVTVAHSKIPQSAAVLARCSGLWDKYPKFQTSTLGFASHKPVNKFSLSHPFNAYKQTQNKI